MVKLCPYDTGGLALQWSQVTCGFTISLVTLLRYTAWQLVPDSRSHFHQCGNPLENLSPAVESTLYWMKDDIKVLVVLRIFYIPLKDIKVNVIATMYEDPKSNWLSQNDKTRACICILISDLYSLFLLGHSLGKRLRLYHTVTVINSYKLWAWSNLFD